MQRMDSVSCIIPCYNSVSTISRAVNSVLAQTSAVDEIILVNDCSTDSTWELILSLAAKERIIKAVSLEKNSGPATARNRGWDIASSHWLAFLDADDTWHRQKVEMVRAASELAPHAGLFGHPCGVRNPNEVVSDPVYTGDILRNSIRPVSALSVKFSNPFSTPSVVLRRDSRFRFNEEMRFVEDYLLWASLILSGVDCVKIDLPIGHLYKARYGASGLSAQTQNMRGGEINALRHLKEQGYLGNFEHGFLQLFWYLKHLKRTWIW
jgi:glycosyltransferase involved in cell wall biosynthesis